LQFAQGELGRRGQHPQRGAAALDASFPWDAEFLHYFVREPFPSRTTGASIVSGRIPPHATLTAIFEMAEHGVIFSDGIEPTSSSSMPAPAPRSASESAREFWPCDAFSQYGARRRPRDIDRLVFFRSPLRQMRSHFQPVH
jgi:hypothetical protein